MNRNDIPWLIKTGGQVLGPMSFDQVYELLKKREINYLDEVSSPLRRWQSLQIHPEFREMVEKIRQSNLSEKTSHDWTPTDHGLTQTMTDISSGELTDKIRHEVDGFTPTGKEIVVHDLREQVSASTVTKGRFQPKGFPTAIEQKQVERTTRWLWGLVAVVLIGVGWVVIRQRAVVANVASMSAEQIKKQVLENIQVGSYAEALKLLRSSDLGQTGDLAFYFGTLLVQVEGQTVLGRRLLLPFASGSGANAKLALVSLGMADLVDGQVDAAEQSFARALALDAELESAKINKVLALLKSGKIIMAREDATNIIQRGSREGIVYIALSESVERLPSTERGSAAQEALTYLRSYRSRFWDYDSEIGVHFLFLSRLLGGKISDLQLSEILDRDPSLSDLHRHNVFVFRGNANWSQLEKLCEQIVHDASSSLATTAMTAKQNTFLASCAYRSGRHSEAKAYIEKAVHQDPKDAQIQAWHYLVLSQTGQAEQASVVLGRAGELNRHGDYKLPILLQARFCQLAGDMDCARDNWQKIYEKNLDDLSAVSGLAAVHASRKAFVEARKLLDRGLKISPDFIPLLSLQMQASREGW